MNELTVKVKVLRPGVFNGRGLKALPPAQEGDIIQVAAGGYAESLADDGWVELVGDTPAVVEVPTETAPPAFVLEALPAEVWVEIPPLYEDVLKANTPAGELLPEEAQPESAPPDPVQQFVRLNGVGTSTAHKLVDAGYTLTTLATADPQKVRSVLGGSVKRIEEWQAEAKKLLGH